MDFFLDDDTPVNIKEQLEQSGATLKFGGSKGASDSEAGAGGSPVENTFSIIKSMMNEELVKTINGIYAFSLKGNYSSCNYLCMY